jgi:hypothetical protein
VGGCYEFVFYPQFTCGNLCLPTFCPQLPPKQNTNKQNQGRFTLGLKNNSMKRQKDDGSFDAMD